MRYFGEIEFNMGGVPCFNKMDEKFLNQLDELRELCGFKLSITSSYRDEAYNRKIGGKPSSYHLLGRAVDISCHSSEQRAIIVKNALNLGLSVGYTSSFVHIDNRDKQLMFCY